ncbi:MAG: 2-iminoacetate synthase ThiH [Candidatus Firestonebacteria bacterium]|nr:2-iminoacetate synthase ThiH [Candidatus Firestonebacteria bacterium]
MTFLTELEKYQSTDWNAFWQGISAARVQTALGKSFLNPEDYAALLSPAAVPFLEAMAQKAHALSLQHFGKTVLLYSPMYLSNFCTNTCTYCGFNAANKIPRKQLTLAEVETEAAAIAQTGIRHILILTGDAPGKADVAYLLGCLQVLKKHFLSIAIEIYAADQADYARLIAGGVDQLTLYQETYNPRIYDQVHLKGPKKDFAYRLAAPERAALAGIRAVNLGALLGLDVWRREAFFTGLHADFLQARFPALEVSLSAPRMRPHAGTFADIQPVSDTDIVQYLLAARLFMPRLGLTLSTRENADFRDRLLPLGITRLSAGSSTAVGGHTQPENNIGQFEIADPRNVPEMQAAVRAAGYQPIFTDWHAI